MTQSVVKQWASATVISYGWLAYKVLAGETPVLPAAITGASHQVSPGARVSGWLLVIHGGVIAGKMLSLPATMCDIQCDMSHCVTAIVACHMGTVAGLP